jgi:hypothetical protein
MKITIEMPIVSECAVTECAYNADRSCHARAITIGDGVHPGCDTFLSSGMHSKETKRTAGVGACKVTGCSHNDDFECMADSIHVGIQEDQVNCLTYKSR